MLGISGARRPRRLPGRFVQWGVAASGTFTTASNGQVSVTFESLTPATWCLEATMTASGYAQGSGEATFST